MLKKIVVTVVLILVFSFSVSAQEVTKVIPEGDFKVYSENPSAVAEILGLDETNLKNVMKETKTVYFAANSNNSKQIRITCHINEFSKRIENITFLSDSEILSLLEEMTGIENIKGEVVQKDGQKFIKTVLASADSGGEYEVTQYITVAQKNLYILSFSTAKSADKTYIEQAFKTYNSPDFISSENSETGIWGNIILASIIGFLIIISVIGYTIIRDLRKKSKENLTVDDIKE